MLHWFHIVQDIQFLVKRDKCRTLNPRLWSYPLSFQNTTKRRRKIVPVALFSGSFWSLSTPLLELAVVSVETEGVLMDPVERRGSSRSPQVSGRYRRRMWLGSPDKGVLMRAYTSHLSVQRFLHSGRSEQRRYEGEAVAAASWRETPVRWPQGTERRLLRLVLFSFPLGSEVLFGLVFTALVYKQDFWLMGTRSLADTFLPFSLLPAQFDVKGKKITCHKMCGGCQSW